jgi:hypothetical protein
MAQSEKKTNWWKVAVWVLIIIPAVLALIAGLFLGATGSES